MDKQRKKVNKSQSACQDFEKWFYLQEDELSIVEAEQLNKHLAKCTACRMAYEKIQSLPFRIQPAEALSNEEKEKIRQGVYSQIDTQLTPAIKGRQLIRLINQWVAAAVVLLFLIYGYEQFYTLRKINQLEKRLAHQAKEIPANLRTQDKLLIINNFFKWEDIKSWIGADQLALKKPDQLGKLARIYSWDQLDEKSLSLLDSTLAEDFYPNLSNLKFVNKEKIRQKINAYLQDVSLATKIYHP